MAVVERSWVMTSPSASGRTPGPVLSGVTSSTYFWPNNVLGRMRACTFDGMSEIWFGFIASFSVASSPLVCSTLTSPTLTPRNFTSALRLSWLPMRSVRSCTGMVLMNALLYIPTTNAKNKTSIIRKATPWNFRLLPIATRLIGGGTRSAMAPLPRDPDGRGRTPDGHGQEQVQDADRHDRGADRLSHGHAHTGRATRREVAVVAVHQHDDHGEEDHLDQAVE